MLGEIRTTFYGNLKYLPKIQKYVMNNYTFIIDTYLFYNTEYKLFTHFTNSKQSKVSYILYVKFFNI